jgi:hypothetical protein
MRRKAESRGISGKTFDAVARESSYTNAKGVAQTAAVDREMARYTAAVGIGLISGDVAFSDFDAFDLDIPDDFDWYYH